MVTIYTENGDSIDIILCGECGATGGEGRESREDRSHWVVKDFCQGKVQFHSIYKHQNQPVLSSLARTALYLTQTFCLWFIIWCYDGGLWGCQSSTFCSTLHLMLLYCVFPLMLLCKLYAMLDIHLESEDPQKASFYLLSVPLPSLGWSKKLPLCWEYFFRLHKKRKWKHNICTAHSPQPENFITSQTHIFWQLNRGDTFPFLDLVLCWKKKIRMELASCIPM